MDIVYINIQLYSILFTLNNSSFMDFSIVLVDCHKLINL